MKYINKEQIKNYLLKSKRVNLFSQTNIIQFIGNDLERCELKVDNNIFTDILISCRHLEIEYHLEN